jgi:hypothetical protein
VQESTKVELALAVRPAGLDSHVLSLDKSLLLLRRLDGTLPKIPNRAVPQVQTTSYTLGWANCSFGHPHCFLGADFTPSEHVEKVG